MGMTIGMRETLFRMKINMKLFLHITLAFVLAMSLTSCRVEPGGKDASNPSSPIVSEKPGEDASALPGTVMPERTPYVTPVGERWMHVLYGREGEAVLLGITTDKEISEYLAVAWDDAAYGFIDGWEQIRAALIEETEQAFEFSGASLKNIPRTGFYVTLMNFDMDDPMLQSPFDWLFYFVRSSTGESYIFPSEWQIGDDPAPRFDPEGSALYVSTSLGIWRITADGRSEKLTTDEYDGKHSSWHEMAAYDRREEMFRLFWISSHVHLSPDRRFIIHTTNRDCYENGSNMSVWRIDLETGEEQRIVEGNAANTIDGFVTNRLVLIDQRFLLDVHSGETTPVTLPDLPNRSIVDTGHGYIVCGSYKDEDGGLSSLHIFRLEPETGALTESFTGRGVFREFRFSPSGKLAYVGYGTEPNRGAETLMLISFDDMAARLLEDTLGGAFQELGGTVARANWLTDNALLLNVWSFVENNNVYSTWIAEW